MEFILGMLAGLVGFMLLTTGVFDQLNDLTKGKVTQIENKKYICHVIEEKEWVKVEPKESEGV